MCKRLPVAWVVPSYVGVCHQEDYCKKIKIPIQNKNIYCSKIWLYNQNKVLTRIMKTIIKYYY